MEDGVAAANEISLSSFGIDGAGSSNGGSIDSVSSVLISDQLERVKG